MSKVQYLFVLLTAQIIAPAHADAGEISAAQQKEIISDCAQLVTDYAYYRDLRDANNVAALFTEDARMQARGHWNEGRQAIRDHVNDDDMSTVSMHMMTTIKIMPQDENTATGVSYAAVAHEARNEDPSAAAIFESFTVLGKYLDTFIRTDEGWKISERQFTVIFRKPDPAASP